MTISVTPTEKGTLILLRGRLDAITSPVAQAEIERHMADIRGPVTLNCEELLYLSSAGLRVLLHLSNKNKEPLALIGLTENVREVIEISGFSLIFKME